MSARGSSRHAGDGAWIVKISSSHDEPPWDLALRCHRGIVGMRFGLGQSETARRHGGHPCQRGVLVQSQCHALGTDRSHVFSAASRSLRNPLQPLSGGRAKVGFRSGGNNPRLLVEGLMPSSCAPEAWQPEFLRQSYADATRPSVGCESRVMISEGDGGICQMLEVLAESGGFEPPIELLTL